MKVELTGLSPDIKTTNLFDIFVGTVRVKKYNRWHVDGGGYIFTSMTFNNYEPHRLFSG